MIEFRMEYFLAVLLGATVVGLAWVALCVAIAPLRSRLGLRYGGAVLLSWLPALLVPGGLTIYGVTATLLFNAALCFAAFYITCRSADPEVDPLHRASAHAH